MPSIWVVWDVAIPLRQQSDKFIAEHQQAPGICREEFAEFFDGSVISFESSPLRRRWFRKIGIVGLRRKSFYFGLCGLAAAGRSLHGFADGLFLRLRHFVFGFEFPDFSLVDLLLFRSKTIQRTHGFLQGRSFQHDRRSAYNTAPQIRRYRSFIPLFGTNGATGS